MFADYRQVWRPVMNSYKTVRTVKPVLDTVTQSGYDAIRTAK